MTISNTAPILPLTIAEAIARAAEAMTKPKAERMKVHRANLQRITFFDGVNGATRYWEEYPEAEAIRVQSNPIAYERKPQGYDDHLASQAERWLISPASLTITNAADVARMNEKFGTNYPPAKHFNDPLSKGRLKKISAVFARYGVPLDIKAATTMSKVKAAARAGMGRVKAERQLARSVIVSGDTLVIHGRPFTVTKNGERECVRPMIGGKRQRLYLDQIEWLAGLLDDGGADPLPTTIYSSGDLAYPVDPLENAVETTTDISSLAYSGELAGLTEWLAIQKAQRDLPMTGSESGVDPLEFEPT